MKIITYSIFLLFSSILYAQADISGVKILLQRQKIAEAELLLHKIVSNQPEDEEAISLLGDIASYQKNWDKAIKFYGQLVEKNPSNPKYNLKYGGALGMKALDVPRMKALIYISDIKTHLEKAANLDPQQVESRRALVELYMQLPMLLGGSQKKAESFVSELRSISSVDYYLAKGFVSMEDEGPVKARAWFIKAFDAFEKIPEKNRRNNIYYELGKASGELNIYPNKGLEYLTDFIENYSYKDIHGQEYPYYRKAQIYANLNQKTEALKNINKALTLRPNFKEAKEEKERIINLN